MEWTHPVVRGQKPAERRRGRPANGFCYNDKRRVGEQDVSRYAAVFCLALGLATLPARADILLPTRQELAARKADALGAIDFLKVAADFADCMIQHGRDRYGETHSPLFAVLLTREKQPRIGPYPLFADPGRVGGNPVFNRFDFNKCTNYPGGLGGEGPHKVTVYGCDVYEDRALYSMLIDLSRISGNPVYKAEAEKALAWWFTQTLGPADLYPWGEHLGLDFQYECPTYFKGPSEKLYAACYHEIKDTVPFLDFLAALPDPAFLERYALGV